MSDSRKSNFKSGLHGPRSREARYFNTSLHFSIHVLFIQRLKHESYENRKTKRATDIMSKRIKYMPMHELDEHAQTSTLSEHSFEDIISKLKVLRRNIELD